MILGMVPRNETFLWYITKLCVDFLAGTISEKEFDTFYDYFSDEEFQS